MTARDFDIYKSSLARHQLQNDMEPYRRSLYTNTKPDLEPHPLTGESCDCDAGGTGWERNGVAMRVRWPRDARRKREPDRELEAGA